MRLDSRQKARAHNLFTRLNKMDRQFLAKKGVTHCKKCNGTGLGGTVKMHRGGYGWDTGRYCSQCWGVGFAGIKHLKSFDDKTFICGTCQGVGCKECKSSGFVDWIKHAMGR